MTDNASAFGLPITGEKPEFNSRTNATQLPIEDLRPMVEAVFAHDDVESVRWRQYTPYFNDGDVCEFSIYAGEDYGFVELKSHPDHENENYGGPYFDSRDPAIAGGWDEKYVSSIPEGTPESRIVRRAGNGTGYSNRYNVIRTTDEPMLEHPASHDVAKLEGAINSGAFYDALYSVFGDHVVVTVRRDKIELESYEHD